MIKKRIKNHWDGLSSFEKLVNEYEIYPDGFAANFISIDRIKSIQEIIFQIEYLLSINNDIEENHLFFPLFRSKTPIFIQPILCFGFRIVWYGFILRH